MTCPYCGKEAQWVENSVVYGRRYGKSYMCWYCECGAYVGCHNNTNVPLGTLANKETREWRMKAHEAIDPLWRSGERSRGDVYNAISGALGYRVHVGESSIEQCRAIIEAASHLTNRG